MPMSLKVMLKKFVHKGQITQDEYDALIKKLEGHDKEIRSNAIDEFCTEAIKQFAEFDRLHGYPTVADCEDVLNDVAEQLKEE